MTVSAILAEKGRRVETLAPDVQLSAVCKMLADNKIGAIVMTHPDGTIAGILSERDVVRAMAAEGAAAFEAAASTYMSARVSTCAEEDTIDEVMARMTQGRFRHMPVVKNRRLIGLVSIGDVVKRKIEKAEKEAAEIRAYIASA